MATYPCIIIHGFLANPVTNMPIHRTLRRHGIETFDVPLPGFNTLSVDRATDILARKVLDVLTATRSPKVNLVGISKGGVVALNFLRHHDGHRITHKAITLASPLSGTHAVESLKKVPLIGKKAQELHPQSAFMKSLHGPRLCSTQQADIISIYAEGDPFVNEAAATIPEATVLKAPAGVWPLAHYQLALSSKCLALVVDQLRDTNTMNNSELDDHKPANVMQMRR